tara:strand:- start:406 stop:1569 length:1164 start_codon:yes stop_codon:yes gene_type:complete
MKKLEDYEWICPEPFTNLYTAPPGHYVPCCAIDYTELFKNYGDEILNTNEYSINDYFKSNFLKKMQKAMKENDKNFLKDICKNCIKSEEMNNRSHRQWYLQRFIKNEFKHKKKELERIIHNESYPTFLHSVEATSVGGNICNLACNMCGSGNSSKFNSEEIKLGETNVMQPQPVNYKEFYDDLYKFNVLEFKFTGGEPLLTKKNYEIMSKQSKDTMIRVITNGTVDPSNLIKVLKDFNKVVINVSAEGPKDVTNYIRHGSDFDIVLKHYDMMQNVWGDNVMFTATINALNIARVSELLRLRKGHAGSLVTNNFYSLNSIPDDIKETYLQKLYEEGEYDLIKYLENAEYNETDMWIMLRHIKRRDRLRGTNLLKVFPEWKEYYETCNG